MRFGFQISISGGFSEVVPRAKKLGCNTVQLFSRNPRSWGDKKSKEQRAKGKNIRNELESEIKLFKDGIKAARISPVFVHLPYLPNLASPNKELWKRSVGSLCIDLNRAGALGAFAVIIHPGNRMYGTLEEAIDRVAEGINLAFNRVNNGSRVLIENTAGEGTAIGYNFAQISSIFDKVENKGGQHHWQRLGVCLDTAHLFQSGYNIKTLECLKSVVAEFDELIGLPKLWLLHLNDSKTPLGSHRDLHWHIGEGYIGLSGFKNIVNLPEFCGLPAILETPRKSDADDIKNITTIRQLKTTG